MPSKSLLLTELRATPSLPLNFGLDQLKEHRLLRQPFTGVMRESRHRTSAGTRHDSRTGEIRESTRMEKPSEVTGPGPWPSPAVSPRAWNASSSLSLNTARAGDFTSPQGTPFPCLIALPVKKLLLARPAHREARGITPSIEL